MTEEDVLDIINRVGICIDTNMYTIRRGTNRLDNEKLLEEFYIREAEKKQIIKSLSLDDFSKAEHNNKDGYKHELLYFFGKKCWLTSIEGITREVELYIKINLVDTKKGDYTIIISFHEGNYPIVYGKGLIK